MRLLDIHTRQVVQSDTGHSMHELRREHQLESAATPNPESVRWPAFGPLSATGLEKAVSLAPVSQGRSLTLQELLGVRVVKSIDVGMLLVSFTASRPGLPRRP